MQQVYQARPIQQGILLIQTNSHWKVLRQAELLGEKTYVGLNKYKQLKAIPPVSK